MNVIPTNDTLPIWLKPFRRRRQIVLPAPTGPLQQTAAPTAPDPVAPEPGTDEPKENRYRDLLPSLDEIASRCSPPETRRIPRAARPTRLPAPAGPARRILPSRQERPDPTVEPAHPPTRLNMEAVLLPALTGGEIEEVEDVEVLPASLRSPLRRTVLLAVAAGTVVSLALGLIVVLVMVVSGPAPAPAQAASAQAAPAVATPKAPPAEPVAVNVTPPPVADPPPADTVTVSGFEPEIIASAARRRRPALRRRARHRPRRQVDADALLMAGGGTQAAVDADALIAVGTSKGRSQPRSTRGVVVPGWAR